ncbi:EamA family transporter RarD [Calidifontibacter sp. DB0510]|uniref:EamA family transporter RarD n=1 Tax=Metallococcus carri TaxID=1656884 RepID=A0A967AYB1_9MICO|nr:EamA family transporter RarD [Metallococcus carri]NHN55251.1 EamA family transporter RarD [Metallococcus carri]NOP36328.1 EamA family transporter RarD [Calidifontibacter sp. DB2511S]
MKQRSEQSQGTVYGFLAYLLWGAFPLYFAALKPATAFEVLCHRILWTLVVCLIALAATKQLRFLRDLARDPRRLGTMAVAGVLIAINWVVYIFAVVTGHTVEAALGYFLNPLVTVALGVIVLREKLRPLQWVAVGVGVIACVYLAIDYGRPPLISITLALTFAAYGLMKKRIGGSANALQSLAAESAVLAPVAVVILAVITARGETTFTTQGVGHTLLLLSTGIATAVPLLLFAAAASRVPLVTIGLLQFITPVLQLLCGVLVLGEHMNLARWIGFAIVWVALAILTVDSLQATTRARRLARAAQGAAC